MRAVSNSSKRRQRWIFFAVATVLFLASVSCSVGDLLLGGRTSPTGTPTRIPRPTFTPAPGMVTPTTVIGGGVQGDLPPGVTAMPPVAEATAAGASGVVIFATATPAGGTSLPAASSTPTITPTPLPTLTPAPTPYLEVNAARADVRRGPGATYEVLGQVKQGDRLMLLARAAGLDWWQACCVANQPVWVPGEAVQTENGTERLPVITAAPPATLTPTPNPTVTPTASPTSLPPFDIAQGPMWPIQRDTGIMTIWVKVYEGITPYERPLPGYLLKVFRDDQDVSLPAQSTSRGNVFDYTQKESEGYMPYNLKFEMNGAKEARWKFYLSRPDGSRVSPITEFTTLGDAYRNQVVYIAYWLAR
jgi:hypothetical protein